MSVKTVKRPRTTKSLFSIYVEYLERNSVLRTGKLSPNLGAEDVQNLWVKLSQALNACGDGPTRDSDGWKKVFTEWKSQVRKKARENKVLNELELRLLKATGTVVVDGISEIPELGINEVDFVQAVDGVELELADHVEQSIQIVEEENAFNDIHKDTHLEQGIEKPEDYVQSEVGRKSIKKKKKNSTQILLEEYQRQQEVHQEGLQKVAASLQSIANGIHRLCNILEKKNGTE
ncbi:hypothetical protein PPYR_04546 [Photinus pyralis]|uniref:Regulatory protein zeste n=1 Tax=Photinus pyralis TaxID=7054 RepID=A0A5N4AYX5_PHOPY|nr:hypothetical protein PPYR_04546 [Photinus pyralis]